MISFAIRTVDYVGAAEKSGLRQDCLRYDVLRQDCLRHDPQVAEPPLCAMKSVICRQHWSGVPQTISTASMHSGSMVSDLCLAASSGKSANILPELGSHRGKSRIESMSVAHG